jgi:LmbE family N-acetylglucosaminyl deacetylase
MPTLMAVHAHPDDEASSTGGILARYSAEGFTTVVVTCTNGELGDMPDGTKPGQEGHDEELVVKLRRTELERACDILGVTHLEMLGYRDSGMADWEHKGHAEAFCNVPTEESTARIAGLFEKYRPDVVVTYNHDSPYDHPDHVTASKITQAAVATAQRSGAAEGAWIPKKFYFTGFRANRFQRIRELLEEQGVELPPRPEHRPDWIKRSQELEAKITSLIDVSAYVDQKMQALRTHESQINNFMWNRLPQEALAEVFGEEAFTKVSDLTNSSVPETDLFAGLRGG